MSSNPAASSVSSSSAQPPLRVVFLGTPQFSVPTLEALLASEAVEIIGVLTQPDKPSGRGQKLSPPPVKEVLQHYPTIPVFQPTRLRKDPDLIQWLADQAPDFLVTIAFGQILPQSVLDIPRLGTVNVHASLLPEYRGANPIQWAVLDGKTETGMTTMLTDAGVDTGDMLLKETLAIGPDETAGELAERMAVLGGPLLLKTLIQLRDDVLTPVPQEDAQATHAPKLAKEDSVLDWRWPASTLHNRIRGQNPWPGSLTYFRETRLKVIQAQYSQTPLPDVFRDTPPGTIVQILPEGIQIQTGEGALDLLRVQPAGKKAMPAHHWANGVFQGKLPPGVVLTSTPAIHVQA